MLLLKYISETPAKSEVVFPRRTNHGTTARSAALTDPDHVPQTDYSAGLV